MKRNRLKALVCVILCSWLLSACVHTRVAATERAVAESLAALPSSADFQVVATTSIAGHPDRFDQTCTYGDVSQALVTDLVPQEAIMQYTQIMEAAGWTIAEKSPALLLERGIHERLDIFVVEDEDQAGVEPFINAYRAAWKRGQTVLIIDLTYIDPQRDGC